MQKRFEWALVYHITAWRIGVWAKVAGVRNVEVMLESTVHIKVVSTVRSWRIRAGALQYKSDDRFMVECETFVPKRDQRAYRW